ncbi:MAG: hypothetical protein VX278_10080, partial [Myxococcota bacterium]|nr:hypothetical protein [Myxococcota bacterium]
MSFTVVALYKFVSIDPKSLQEPIKAQCEREGITGTLLLANEGINGTIAGTERGIDAILTYLRSLPPFADLEYKLSHAAEKPFYRLKVRLKKEIVTMGVADIDPTERVGTYVSAENWNQLISDPSVVLIDTRNDYESCVGSFEGAVYPNTRTFRDFPKW